MRITKNLGMLMLGLWLIIWGVVTIVGLGSPTVLAVLAVLVARSWRCIGASIT